MLVLALCLLATCCVLGLALHWRRSRRWSHLPGCHWLASLPVVGHAYLALVLCDDAADPVASVESFRRRFGDLFRLDVGHDPTVVLCRYDDIVAASKNDDLMAKPYDDLFPFIDVRGKDPDGEMAGVFFCKGRTWRDLRKFTLRELSNLGMGKKDTMEAIILQEAEACMDALRDDCHKPIAMHHRFSVAINNVIWRLVTGKRTSQRDPEMTFLTRTINDMFDGFDPSKPLALLQMNYRLVYSAMKMLGITTLPDYALPMKKMVSREIASSEADPSGSFIERFLAQIEDSAGDPTAVFHGGKGRTQLLGTAMDLFVAGTDTTTTQLEWCVLYLTAFPDAQRRMREEVDSATDGGRRAVSLADRARTPYVMSALEEMLRFTPELFVNVPHFAQRDTEIRGHKIPAGTQILHWHHGVHFDPDYFPSPHEFRGDRFLSADGRAFRGPDERVLTFSTGRRRCVGEVLARAELYVFIATLLQQFDIALPEGKRPNLEWGRVILPHPKPFDVVLTPRRQGKSE